MKKALYGSRKKYHFIYKTTNVLSGRYYIGMHSTDDLKDGYLGSGDLIRKSIKKYGKENHKLEILEFCKNREELVAREKEVVNLQEISKENCLNLKVGGNGGFKDEEHMKAFLKGSKDSRFGLNSPATNKLKELRKNPEWVKTYSKKISESKIKYYKNNSGSFLGKSHTETTKKKMSEAKKGIVKGEKNSQYGTMWICNDVLKENKKIHKGTPIPNGWRKGRICKESFRLNNQKDTVWIYNVLTNKTTMINKNKEIPVGWKLGRNKKNS